MDSVTIQVERKPETSASAKQAAGLLLSQRIKSYVGISNRVIVHDEGGIPRSQGKAQRVVDKRK
jgi:phenylacetate-CoA ligase